MSDEEHFHVLGIPCPVRSPDLTVPDFILWGYLKEYVHRNRPHTTQELKRAIRYGTATINQELLRGFFDSFVSLLKTKCCKQIACFVHKNCAFRFTPFLLCNISCVKSVSRLCTTLYMTSNRKSIATQIIYMV